jgi:hypothetical protein
VRGHSNVQGDRTMGIEEKPTKAFLDRLQKVFDFEPPRHHGWTWWTASSHAGWPRQGLHRPGRQFRDGHAGHTFEALRRAS